MNRFRDRLKEIRDAKEAELRSRVPLTDEELGLNDGTQRRIRIQKELTGHIERLMTDFIAEAAGFTINRGFFEGKYSLATSLDEWGIDEDGEPKKMFSRVNYLLGTNAQDASIDLAVKMTVRNRDLPKRQTHGCLESDEDVTSLRRFAEESMIHFAEQYFSGRKPNHQPVPQSP